MGKAKRIKSSRKQHALSQTKAKVQTISGRDSPITTTGFYFFKWIACITMVIDHVALFFQSQCAIPPETYLTMRGIGRTAFPLFAYLLVESFHHTENKKKHLFRIGMLALVSEIPYDIINISKVPVGENILNFGYQNVCLSLFISFALLMITNVKYDSIEKLYGSGKFGKLIKGSVKIIFLGIAMIAAYFLHVDYSFSGVLFVFLLNLARDKKHKRIFQALAFALLGVMGKHYVYLFLIVPFAFIVLVEYSKKNERKDNVVFRVIRSKFSRKLTGIFYPLHMIILIIVRAIMVL